MPTDKKYHIQLGTTYDTWDAERWEREGSNYMKANPTAEVFEEAAYDPADEAEHDQVFINGMPVEKYVAQFPKEESGQQYDWKADTTTDKRRVRHVPYWKNMAEQQESAMKGMDPNSEQYATASAEYEKNPFVVKVREQEKIFNADAELYYGIRDMENQLAGMNPEDENYATLLAQKDADLKKFEKSPYAKQIRESVAKSEKEWENYKVQSDELTARLAGVQQTYGQLNANDPEFKALKKEEKAILAQLEANPYYTKKQEWDLSNGKAGADLLKTEVDKAQKEVDAIQAEYDAEKEKVSGFFNADREFDLWKLEQKYGGRLRNAKYELNKAQKAYDAHPYTQMLKEYTATIIPNLRASIEQWMAEDGVEEAVAQFNSVKIAPPVPGAAVGFLPGEHEVKTELGQYRVSQNYLDLAEQIRTYGRKGQLNFNEAAIDFGKGVGFWAQQFADKLTSQLDIQTYTQIYGIYKRLEKELGNLDFTEEDLEAHLSHSEQALLLSYMEYLKARQEMGDKLSWWFKAGEMLGEALPFMAEMFLTGGLSGAADDAVKGVVKTKLDDVFARWFSKTLEKKAGKVALNFFSDALSGAAGTLTAAAIDTVLAPSSYAGVVESMIQLKEDEQGNTVLSDSAGDILKGAANQYGERLSEKMGNKAFGLSPFGRAFQDIMKTYPGFASKLTSLPVVKFGKAIFDSDFVKDLTSLGEGAGKFMKRFGQDGVLAEIGEELWKSVYDEALGINPKALEEFFDEDNFMPMVISFVALNGARPVVTVAELGYANSQKLYHGAKVDKMLRAKLSDEQADYVMAQFEKAETPQEMYDVIKSVTEGLAGAGASWSEIKEILKYAENEVRYKSLVYSKAYNEGEVAQSKRKEIEDEMGGRFWMLEEEAPENATAETEAEGETTEAKPEEKKPEKVQMAMLNNGQTVFVLGEANEMGDFPTLDLTTKRKGKANLSDIKTDKETGKPISRTWDMQSFINMQVAKDTKAKDSQRMEQEKAANIAKVTESVMADPVINLGTEAEPNIVRVQSTTDAGVKAIDENGNEIDLTWEQVGNKRGIRVTPMTRQEIAEKEVEEFAKRQSERIKARGGASEISDDADFVATDAEAASEYIPKNPDGSVDEKSFWENDPEGWAKWNDKQNKDDGADTLQQIEAAKAEINALLAEARKGMKTSDPNQRKLAKAKAVELEERLARMEALEFQYSAEAQTEKRLQEWENATGVKFTRLNTLADVARVSAGAVAEAASGRLRAFMYNGKPYIYTPGLAQREVKGAAEADEIFVHEAVAHSGLKGLLGQRAFNELCEQVWEMMSEDARRLFMAYPGVNGDFHVAADEYIAHVAEKIGSNVANYAEKTIWEKIVAFVRKALRAMGVNLKLTEAELSDLLQLSYADLAKNVQAESQRVTEAIEAEQKLPAEVRKAIADMEANKLTPDEQKITTANDVAAAQKEYDRLAENAISVKMGETTEEYIARKKAYNEQLDAAQMKLRNAKEIAQAVMEKYGEQKTEEVEKKNGKTVVDFGEFRPSVVMSEEAVAAPRSLDPSIIGDENAPIAETDGNGSLRFSTLSYEQGGRDYLVNWLAKEKYMARDEKEFIVSTLDSQYELAKQLGEEFPVFGAWSSAEINVDENGNPVMSVVKENGDYAMNLDFSLICKKRRPLNALLDVMIADRMLDMRQLDEEEIATINKVIQRHGFEVACALCFVDSKRYRTVKVAKTFADMYNEIVESLIPAGSDIVAYENNYAGYEYIKERNEQKIGRDLASVPASELNWAKVDEILKGVKRPKSVEQKIAWALRKNASQRRLVNATDFVTNLGFESVKKNNPDLLKIYNAKKGTGGPKASFGDVQYLNDILKSGKFTAEKAAKVGGVRIQSFSDYMGHMFFDYMQMVAELSAKGLTAHAYTKEEAFARIFGMTGIKINMSLVPAVAKDGVAPGLDAEGNYAWAVPYTDEQGNEIQGQTFPPEVAFELQKDPRYSGNLGVIAVGVSDAHILKMLNDENIHFIIPYHKSSLNPIVAKMTGIDKYEDYTDVQNEKLIDKPQYANLESKQKTNIIKKRKFDFYGSLARTNDPKATAKEYLEHCKKNDLVPKYEAFSKHENYYKLLADFNLYDFNTGEYAPQTAVKMNFPEELNDLVRASVAHNEQLESDLKEKVGKMAEDVKAELGGLRYSTIKEVNKNFNEELQQLIEGKLPEGHVFQLGLPSANLLSTGIPNLPIALQSATLLKKAGDRFHQYELSDIKDLVNHIQKPWAIFAYGDSQKAQNLIVGITKGNKQFLVGLSLNPTVNGQTLNINSIRNVFPKDNHEWLNWVQQGKLLRVDEKEKIQDIINALRINPVDYVNIDLDSVAKIVENFENPTLGNNFSPATLRMSTRMDESQQGDLRFSVSNENQAIFVSNASKAVEDIQMGKATPEQWLNMLTKNGGLKVAEDKWLGLSDWLKASDKKSLTKDEVLQFINENKIQIEETHYDTKAEEEVAEIYDDMQYMLQRKFDAYKEEFLKNSDDEFAAGYVAFKKLREELQDFTNEIDYPDDQVTFTFDYENDRLMRKWADKLGVEYEARPMINDIRLRYTTEGLENKHEIALTIPTIEPWEPAMPEVHFADAGEGRAIAWIRFGETTTENGESILVIDEIQSSRHQEGREKGYKAMTQEEYTARMNEKYGTQYFGWQDKATPEEWETYRSLATAIPAAPFEKNWHELAMKRMLRYAAEKGYDAIAWTKGEQQAERYDIGAVVDRIEYIGMEEGLRDFSLFRTGSYTGSSIYVNEQGVVEEAEDDFAFAEGERLSDVVGGELAEKMLGMEEGQIINKEQMVGGEGMKGFYDKMLPSFMNKYGKKWGVKVSDMEFPNLEDGLTMHSVPVTEEMRESVMQGQLMFSVIGEIGASRDATMEGVVRMQNLDIARQMEKELNPKWGSKDNNEALKIKAATGWERGSEGKWRYETFDIQMKPIEDWLFNKEKMTLKDIVEPGILLELYPELGDVVIKKNKSVRDNGAWYNDATNEMQLPFAFMRAVHGLAQTDESWAEKMKGWIKDLEESIIHETQHYIQDTEGFARGGNESIVIDPAARAKIDEYLTEMEKIDKVYESLAANEKSQSYGKFLESQYNTYGQKVKDIMQKYGIGREGYMKLGGEVESRNMERRSNMTMDERRKSLLASTEDVAREDQILIDNDFRQMTNTRFSVKPEVRAEMDGILANAMVDGLFERDADGVHMLAPNGERSNLDMDKWAMVRTQNFKQWFGDWINDPENASKVVDENGEPRVVYHGTTNEFNTFERNPERSSNPLASAGFWFGESDRFARSFVVNSVKNRLRYGKRDPYSEEVRVVNGFVNIRNPFVFETPRDTSPAELLFSVPQNDAYTQFREAVEMHAGIKYQRRENAEDVQSYIDGLKEEGYDGIIIKGTYFDKGHNEGRPNDQYCAFEPNQIKSIHNNGEFSESGDIRFSIRDIKSRDAVPKVRGGWTEAKILKYLKENGTRSGVMIASWAIAQFDNVEELKEHMFYHGTQYGAQSLKPSITMSDREIGRIGGGGYGEKYWGISVSKSKKVASNFSTGRSVKIYPIILLKDAKVIERPDFSDAWDAESHIVELWEQGVDAVWIGKGKQGGGEQELLILNPRAVVNIGTADFYEYYGLGSAENPLRIADEASIEKMYETAKEYASSHAPAKPIKPREPYKPRAVQMPDLDILRRFDPQRAAETEAYFANAIEKYKAEMMQYEADMREYELAKAAYDAAMQEYENSAEKKAYDELAARAYKDIRFSTSMELDERFGDAWRNQQNEDGRHSTQVANTKSTYEKIGNWMKEAGLEGKAVLDASSGLGLGTQALREMGFKVDDVEPFPSENREAPTFASYDDIDQKYDVVISNAVLNVIPDDWREDVLRKMASVVKDGGKIIINTRPASNISKQGVEGKTRITLDSPSEILVKRGDRIAAYQKGFTSEELADWIKSVLGEGWRVEKATKKNSGISGEGTAVVVKEPQGMLRFSTRPTSIDIEAVKGIQLFESMGYDLEGQMKLAEDSVVAALKRIKYWSNSKKPGAQQGLAGAQHAFEVAKRQDELLRDVQRQLIDVTYMEPTPSTDDAPQNIREYISSMLRGKNGSRLTPETLEHELGWSAGDREGMKYIVSKNGMTIDELAELIMGDAPAQVLRGMESDEVKNEILEFLQSVRTYAEIRDYIAEARMAEAKEIADQHNAEIDRFKAEFEAKEGMTVEQYNEMIIQQMKEARDAWLAAAENPGAFVPEEEKDVTDVPSDEDLADMSVEEIVNSGKQKVMEQAGRAKDSFMERVFKINERLDKVRAALAAQREYDKTTATLIADLANELLENGALSKVTRAEIKRIVSAVKNAVGTQDIAPYVDRIMDIMIGNQIRNAKNRLTEFLKIKGKKVNSSGVEVQGKLDIEGQSVLAAMKEGLKYDAESLADAIADAEDRLFDESQVISRDAANRLAGLYLAQEHMENIKASEAEETRLRNELEEAKKERRAGRMTKSQYREYLKSIEDAIRENRMQRVNAYEALLDSMADRVMASIAKADALREADKARIESIHHFANSDMQGMPANELEQKPKAEGFWNNDAVRFFLSPLATFDQMLRHFAPKSRDGKGYLWNHFMGGWMKAAENEYTGIRDAHVVLDERAKAIFGKDVKRWSDIFGIIEDLPKMKVQMYDAGVLKDYELTQGNLMYIYMVNKMSDGKMKLRRMGITEEDVDAIVRNMDSRLIDLADWLQDSFLPSLREKYNAVHERLFGAPMAAIDNYFPLVINQNARTREEDVNNPQGNVKPSTITGAIVKRTKNSAALDLLNADAIDVVLGHIEEMEHWAAFAEWNRDLNTLLSYKLFRNRLQNASGIYGAGTELWKNFRTAAEIAAGVYQPAGKGAHDKLALNLAKGVTGAKIAFRVYTALKQFLSMPAFVSDARMDILAKNMANPKEAWDWCMENLPLFEKRWKSRQAGDSRLMETDSDWKMWKNKVVEWAGRVGMTPNALVDAITVSIGAKSIYESKFKKYVEYGYTEEQAAEKAKLDAQVLFNESQQSNEAAFLSQMQVDRTWWTSLVTVFRNSSMGYQRMYVDALRNLGRMMKKGYKEESIEYMKKQMMRDGLTEEQAQRAAEKIYSRSFYKNAVQAFTFGFLVEFAWNLGPVAVYLLMGDDDDEKWSMLKDAAVRGAVGGPFEGLTAGQLISSLIGNAVMGERISETDGIQLPAISDLESLKNLWDTERYRALNDLVNLAGQAFAGVNPQTFTDIVVSVIDACNGDLETADEVMFAVMRILQVPQSQIDKLIMDEIDFKVDEGLDMTIEEFAKRYADYKMMRNAPLTGWMYSDEEAKEREDKYIKRFIQNAEDLKRTRGNDIAKEFYQYYDIEHEAVSATLRDLKSDAEDAALNSELESLGTTVDKIKELAKTEEFPKYSALLPFVKTYEAYRKIMKAVTNPEAKKVYEKRMYDARNALVARLREMQGADE